ncbi:MAG: hypothetical protein AAF138_07400 [Planctomycetota bacterium]
MTTSAKSTSLQHYQIILYSRALHPELFDLTGRRALTSGDYELETWVMPGSHMLRFGKMGHCMSELVTARETSLPTHGVINAEYCAGERDYEHRFNEQGVTYLSTVQTESLSENLYIATYDEMDDHARANDSLAHRWTDDHGRNLSVIDLQTLSGEAHMQAFHLIANGGLVLRTQAIFEIA